MPILHRWDEHEAEGSGAAWRYDDSSSGQESAHGAKHKTHSCGRFNQREATDKRIGTLKTLKKSDEELRRQLLDQLIEAKLMGSPKQILQGADPSKLPMRELPHGTVAGLYLQYCAYCRSCDEPAASKTVFFEKAREWHQCLRFHRKTVHAVCAVCSELRAKIRKATDFTLHCTLADQLLFHFQQQYKDRQTYYIAREREHDVSEIS
ncbi:unnamed protein product [Cladocopium goreaui]|uniref:Uncharacterized protein n=1 Tax=Cladocopium goreaui TaxID=2562237 RepID=A0A9P1CYQ8_9DINO|nr:unnamed protein product [Cladocopium goreaui]